MKDCNVNKLNTDGHSLQPGLKPPPVDTDKLVSNALIDLTIEDCVFDIDALELFCQLLSRSGNIKRLVFTNNESPTEATAVLAKRLVANSRLQTLDLTGFDGGHDSVEAIGALLEAEDCHIEKLVLSKNSLLLDATPLARALRTNKSLLELDLSVNELKGMDSMAQALQTNQTLATLNISKTTITDDELEDETISEDVSESGAPISFFVGLAKTHGLRTLDISNVQLSYDSVREFSESLGQNLSIRTALANGLTLDEDGSLEGLFHSLKTNATLQTVEIGRNTIEMEGIDALASLFVSNTTLESLSEMAQLRCCRDCIITIASRNSRCSIHVGVLGDRPILNVTDLKKKTKRCRFWSKGIESLDLATWRNEMATQHRPCFDLVRDEIALKKDYFPNY